MSANVSVEVVKADGCIPWDSFYLGQLGTRRALSGEVAEETPIMNAAGNHLYPVTFARLGYILFRHRDSFYVGNDAPELETFLRAAKAEEDDYVVFLVFA